jgi:hypothetical protein
VRFTRPKGSRCLESTCGLKAAARVSPVHGVDFSDGIVEHRQRHLSRSAQRLEDASGQVAHLELGTAAHETIQDGLGLLNPGRVLNGFETAHPLVPSGALW